MGTASIEIVSSGAIFLKSARYFIPADTSGVETVVALGRQNSPAGTLSDWVCFAIVIVRTQLRFGTSVSNGAYSTVSCALSTACNERSESVTLEARRASPY